MSRQREWTRWHRGGGSCSPPSQRERQVGALFPQTGALRLPSGLPMACVAFGDPHVSTISSTASKVPKAHPPDCRTAQTVAPQQREAHLTPEDQTGPFTLPGHQARRAEQRVSGSPIPWPRAPCLAPRTMSEEKGSEENCKTTWSLGRLSHPKETKQHWQGI